MTGIRMTELSSRRLDIEAIAGLRQPPEVEAEVETALRWFIRNVLEREPRSVAFLDEVRAYRPLVGVMSRTEAAEPEAEVVPRS